MSAPRKVVESAPARIWLQIADDDYYADQPFPEPASDQITWCADSVMDVEVKYVRADLVAALIDAAADVSNGISPFSVAEGLMLRNLNKALEAARGAA